MQMPASTTYSDFFKFCTLWIPRLQPAMQRKPATAPQKVAKKYKLGKKLGMKLFGQKASKKFLDDQTINSQPC